VKPHRSHNYEKSLISKVLTGKFLPFWIGLRNHSNRRNHLSSLKRPTGADRYVKQIEPMQIRKEIGCWKFRLFLAEKHRGYFQFKVVRIPGNGART